MNRSQFWKSTPLLSLVFFLGAVFLTFASIGPLVDVLMQGRGSWPSLWLSMFFSGAFAIAYALIGSGFFDSPKRWYFFPVLGIAQFFVMSSIYRAFPPLARSWRTATPEQMAQIQQRLPVDALLAMVTVVLGYAFFVLFSSREGERYFRAHTEIELAREIHLVLVPPIAAEVGGFEIYGESHASGEVGGDLVDFIYANGKWVAYIADVSGHGVAPGVVMGMVKSSARTMLTASNGAAPKFLDELNRVIHPLKKPNMFVTMGYVAQRDGSDELEFSLAGHPPILHYRAATRDAVELDCRNLPVGILDENVFDVATVTAQAGDVFLMTTDGILEAANSKGDEFGIEGVKRVLLEMPERPLKDIFRAIQQAADDQGARTDDQSILLIRKGA